MSTKDSIIKKVKEIMETKFEVEEVTYVPDIADSKLTFGNKGLKFESTVLHIDMRGSTKILNKHNKASVAKIHMAYFHTIVKIANLFGGNVRSFNGDSMLVFFQGTTKRSLSNAVKAAMKMHYMIANSEGINPLLAQYSEIDFGIGLDDGEVLCTKIGVGGESNNKGLFWAGNAVNKSVRLSDLAKDPYRICISEWVYSNLQDDVKYHTRTNALGMEEKIDMWNSETFTYNDSRVIYYYTSYFWTL
ncbi:adenylate/guanylate cyclase domain-containing protein [Bacillus cereus group sp. Bce001]|uniref:adenylate/guanylate cyclase domain-containing protein n=1 Tax=Bacillus cereus group sp. Bce001 TaxID=3445260 RepID=UPI003F211922